MIRTTSLAEASFSLNDVQQYYKRYYLFVKCKHFYRCNKVIIIILQDEKFHINTQQIK